MFTRAERMHDVASDDEDEELQELMREVTDDGFMASEFTSAVQSCKLESGADIDDSQSVVLLITDIICDGELICTNFFFTYL